MSSPLATIAEHVPRGRCARRRRLSGVRRRLGMLRAFEGAAAVAVDPAGDAFVAGALDDPAWPDTYTTAVTTLKLAGSNGSILWRHDASNPASGELLPRLRSRWAPMETPS
jgi:hypothetical protein